VDEMGLSTLIELIQTTDGKKFIKMNQRDRMKRLLSLINIVMCEDVPELPELNVQPAPAPEAKVAPQPLQSHKLQRRNLYSDDTGIG